MIYVVHKHNSCAININEALHETYNLCAAPRKQAHGTVQYTFSLLHTCFSVCLCIYNSCYIKLHTNIYVYVLCKCVQCIPFIRKPDFSAQWPIITYTMHRLWYILKNLVLFWIGVQFLSKIHECRPRTWPFPLMSRVFPIGFIDH